MGRMEGGGQKETALFLAEAGKGRQEASWLMQPKDKDDGRQRPLLAPGG